MENTSKEWGKVVDATVGFQTTSSHGSSFAATSLLERERSRVQAELIKTEREVNTAVVPSKATAPKMSGRALMLAHQYTSESTRNYIDHAKLQRNMVYHSTDPMPRGKIFWAKLLLRLLTADPRSHSSTHICTGRTGERFTNWIDVCSSKGCLMPVRSFPFTSAPPLATPT